VIVAHKPGGRKEDPLVLAYGRILGGRVIVEFDDPFDVENRAVVRCLRIADSIVLGHGSLRQFLPEKCEPKVHIVAPPVPLRIYDAAVRPSRPSVIGWIGGRDQPSQLAEIARCIRGFPEFSTMEIRFVGVDLASMRNLASDVPGLEVVEDIAWEDEHTVAEAISAFLLGLAPYRQRPGTAFKVLQYMAAGALPLVDRTSPGTAFLAPLSPALSELCITNFAEPEVLRASLRRALGALRSTAQEIRRDLRAAASEFDTAVHLRTLLDLN
jgi:hypothetical protein